MTSFVESEKRLNAALVRIDRALDRALALPAGGGGDTAKLRAELDALRAARAAEIAALDDIMTGLEALIAKAPRASDAPFAEDVQPAPGDVLRFDQGES
ncbi:MAG: hypothetical protein ACK5LJ_17825 [Paracoccus sp. (in: a-proteobacteria)]